MDFKIGAHILFFCRKGEMLYAPSRGLRLEVMLSSSPRFFFFCFLESIFQLSSCGFLRPPFGGCRPKSRAKHCPRDVIDPGLFLSCGAEIASRFPGAGSRGMSLLTASPAAPAAVWSAAVRCHITKAKAAVAPVELLSPAHPARYTLNLDVGRLEKFQGSFFLQ